MEDSRIISTSLLIISLVFAVIGAANGIVNGGDPVLNKTLGILANAKGQSTLQLKLADTTEALNIYQTGQYQSNLPGLIALTLCNSTEEFDYLLPKIRVAIVEENGQILFNLHAYMQIALFVAWVFTSGLGTFRDYENWSTNEKHCYISLHATLIVAIIVSFIP